MVVGDDHSVSPVDDAGAFGRVLLPEADLDVDHTGAEHFCDILSGAGELLCGRGSMSGRGKHNPPYDRSGDDRHRYHGDHPCLAPG
jgi:hypothetical protein